MNQYPAITWYLALQLMALAAIPLCWRALNRLPDRGYAVAKSVGLAGAAIFAWLLASLHIVDWGRRGVAIGIIVVAMLSVLASAGNWRQIWVDLRFGWRWIVAAELIFLAAFLVFVYFRSVNPDLWHPARGGEKPMEFAYFNAIIKSTHFPAYDPWFAGGYINYYYFGWVHFRGGDAADRDHSGGVVQSGGGDRLRAGDSELLGVRLVSALVLLALSALPVGLAADWLRVARLALRLRHRQSGHGAPDRHRPDGFRAGRGRRHARVSARLATSCGASGVRLVDWRMPPLDAFWTPTRIIDGTVNEFPYFSFLFADLHPHMMAIPFSLLAMVLALGIIASHIWPEEDAGAGRNRLSRPSASPAGCGTGSRGFSGNRWPTVSG